MPVMLTRVPTFQSMFQLTQFYHRKSEAETIREQEADLSSAPNPNQKRPLEVIPATVPTPLRRDSRLGKYFDYDLSKMINSTGGFLVEDGKEVDEDSRVKERERERQRAKQNLEPRKPRFSISFEVLMIVVS